MVHGSGPACVAVGLALLVGFPLLPALFPTGPSSGQNAPTPSETYIAERGLNAVLLHSSGAASQTASRASPDIDPQAPHSPSNTSPTNAKYLAVEVGTIEAGTGPNESPTDLAYDPFNGNVYVANLGSGSAASSVTVINGSTDAVVASISTSIPSNGFLPSISVNPVSGDVYVTKGGWICIVDGSTNKANQTFYVTGYLGQSAFDRGAANSTGDLFVANFGDNRLDVVNTSSRSLVASIWAGFEPLGIAYDRMHDRVYVTSAGPPTGGPSVIMVFNATSLANITSIQVQAAPSHLTMSPDNTRLFVSYGSTSPPSHNITIVNTTTLSIDRSVEAGIWPEGMAFDEANGNLYVANYGWGTNASASVGSRNLTVLNGSTGALLGRVAVGYAPNGVAYDLSNQCVYVANLNGDYPWGNGSTSVIAPTRIQASVNASSAQVETGYPVRFQASAWGGLPPFDSHSFRWSFGDGVTLDWTSGMVTHSFGSPGTYLANVTAIDTGGYRAYATVLMNVTQGPIVSAILPSPSSVDMGQRATFSVSATNGTPPYQTYNWTGLPSGCTGTTTSSVSCLFTITFDYSITVRVTDSVGGVSGPSPTLVLRVFPDPRVSLISNRSVLDVGQPLTVTASGTMGSGGYLYTWRGLPSGCSGAGEKIACTPDQPGSYSISVNLTDSNRVTANSTLTSIVVNPALAAHAPSVSSSPKVNEFVAFKANSTGGTPPYTITWAFGDGRGAMGENVTHAYSTSGNYTVRVSVIDAVGAQSSTSLVVHVAGPTSSPTNGTGNASGTPPWELYGVVAGVAAVAVTLAVILLFARRSRRHDERH